MRGPSAAGARGTAPWSGGKYWGPLLWRTPARCWAGRRSRRDSRFRSRSSVRTSEGSYSVRPVHAVAAGSATPGPLGLWRHRRRRAADPPHRVPPARRGLRSPLAAADGTSGLGDFTWPIRLHRSMVTCGHGFPNHDPTHPEPSGGHAARTAPNPAAWRAGPQAQHTKAHWQAVGPYRRHAARSSSRVQRQAA